MERSGYGRDGIFRSLRPPLVLPREPNLSMVSFLFKNSISYPDRPALIDADSGETLTFSQCKSAVAKVSHGLIHLGIKKNDVVLIFAPNSIQYPVCFLGIAAIGAIATTSNPLYTAAELSKQVKNSRPKMVITVPELWDKVKDFNIPSIFLGTADFSHIKSRSRILGFQDFMNLSPASSDFPVVSVRQTDTAALLYSSGTTGTSKGVILTHRNFIAASLMINMDQELAGEVHNVFLCVLPMFHVFGLAVISYSQLRSGNTIVSMAKFEFESALRAVEKYRVTSLWIVPPIVLALSKQQGIVKKYDLSSLRHIGSGAAPLGKDVMEDCAKSIPQAAVSQVMAIKT